MAAIAAAAPFSARAWVATHGDALHVDELFIEKLKLAALDRFALDGGDALLEFGDEVRADAAEAYADTWVREGLEALEAHAASGRSLRRAPKPADVDALVRVREERSRADGPREQFRENSERPCEVERSAAIGLQASLVESRRQPGREVRLVPASDVFDEKTIDVPACCLDAPRLYGATHDVVNVRKLFDDVFCASDCARAAKTIIIAGRRSRRQGGKCSLGLGAAPSDKVMGFVPFLGWTSAGSLDSARFFVLVHQRCAFLAAKACKLTVSDLRPAACFLLSYSPHDTKHPLASDVASFGSKERGSKASYSYSDAHVDKAQVPAYDVSAVLYFNTIGSGFDGGGFAFVDGDGDTVVEPRAGRLLVFSSGCENLHRVLAVTRGTRFAMTMWWSLRS
ncbi:hypothetical protein JL720_15721 [Aureococcus anophagefferens]|nr:hypothetical protein JL720_15721 [Aureococcus anophagefferens]